MSVRKTIYLSEEANDILSHQKNISGFINELILKSSNENSILTEILNKLDIIQEQTNKPVVQINTTTGYSVPTSLPQQSVTNETNYSEANVEEEFDDDIPDDIMEDFMSDEF